MTQFGDSAEIVEIATELPDKGAAAQLVCNALAAGVHFASDGVVDLDGAVADESISKLAFTANTPFTEYELDVAACHLSEEETQRLAAKAASSMMPLPMATKRMTCHSVGNLVKVCLAVF